ncbi:MAG: nucleoside-diphosphate kinase [Actinobacteria bacterium]|nr:nucleoside-diphosphate kinase [Actinomycetota bacterium]
MKNELTYALITPYSIIKSRTGGIIGRLLRMSNLELVGARMFVFSDEFVDAYARDLRSSSSDSKLGQGWFDYIKEHLSRGNRFSILPRCMVLLFQGHDARRQLKDDVIGSFTRTPVGDTVRGTYGDLVFDIWGNVDYFEPAAITAPDDEANRRHLSLFSKYAMSDGGILEDQLSLPKDQNIETSLVLLKPDNFERPSGRAGNIIDVFSRTGLFMVAAEVISMTAAQGIEFYGHLREAFVEKLKNSVKDQLRESLSSAFGFAISDEIYDHMADQLKNLNAQREFERIVHYMTGVNLSEITDPAQRRELCHTKSLAILYRGPDAIGKIRTRLGATNPSEAQPGTARSEFAQDLMRNGAHASDSTANAIRERRILGLDKESSDTCRFKGIIDQFLADAK